MKEQFATYEIALKLKELGFDEPCFGYFNSEDELVYGLNIKEIRYCYAYHKEDNIFLAPLWQQAAKWFRENHNLDIIVSSNLLGYGFIIYHRYPPKNTLDNRVFRTYEEALKQATLKAIELCQNKKSITDTINQIE